MTSQSIHPPNLPELLGPVLASLPAAAVANEPPESVLPSLSLILRQRVQYMSSSSGEPWIRLLCYDSAKAAKLAEIAQSGSLHPHPVSGEVEVDWDYDAEIRYRRLDVETLQALVVLKEKELAFQLVYCYGDPIGGDGWRVGEVTAADKPSPFLSFGGVSEITEAERLFKDSKMTSTTTTARGARLPDVNVVERGEDDDDEYWARYDATPANRTPANRTPANKPSPAPASIQALDSTSEDDYYAQYDSVQPAMDNHDPDGEANVNAFLQSRNITDSSLREEEVEPNETNGSWTLAEPPRSSSANSGRSGDDPDIVHPRPESSASSNGSVAKLEAAAENFGVQQHISRSIKSLYMLSRASGMDREEFERIVKTELDMLGLMEH